MISFIDVLIYMVLVLYQNMTAYCVIISEHGGQQKNNLVSNTCLPTEQIFSKTHTGPKRETLHLFNKFTANMSENHIFGAKKHIIHRS